VRHRKSVAEHKCCTGAANFFQPAVAADIGLFGFDRGAGLALPDYLVVLEMRCHPHRCCTVGHIPGAVDETFDL
jgi:hypothetical protein